MTNALEELHSVALSSIDSRDSTYRITTRAEIHELVSAVQQLGLLHPPTLKQHDAEYRIISGFRRIAACRQIGWSKVPAFILNPETTDAACALYAIADNSLQRPLNLVEISRSLFLLSSYFKDEKMQLKYASLLRLSEHRTHIKKIEKICHLPEPIQDGILADIISLAVALDLDEFEPETGVALAGLFKQLQIGQNKQRKLIVLLNEIALREDMTVENLLNTAAVREILDSNEPDRVRKCQQLLIYLHQRRYPTLARFKKEFEKQVNALKLGKAIALLPPGDFEGTSYTLTLRFNNHTELMEHQSKLEMIVRSAGFKKFLGGIKK